MPLSPQECIARWLSAEGASRRLRVIEALSAGAPIEPVVQGFVGVDEEPRRLDLRGIDLSGLPMSKIELPFVRFDDAKLDGATLEDADLQGGSFLRATFLRAQMTGVSLLGAKLRAASLDGANLDGADLSDADCANARMRGTSLRSAKIDGANLEGVQASDADFRGARMRATRISNGDFAGARFDGAEITEVDVAELAGAAMGDARVRSRAEVAEQYVEEERARGRRFLERVAAFEIWAAPYEAEIAQLENQTTRAVLGQAVSRIEAVVEAVNEEPARFVELASVLQACREELSLLVAEEHSVGVFARELIALIDGAMRL